MDNEVELLVTYDPELVEELIFSANSVIDNWESGDLASAVNSLRESLEAMDARFLVEEEA
jgi:hypothetical protein